MKMIKKDLIVKRLEKLHPRLLRVIFLARDLAKARKVGVYLVGGFVRDLLLGVDNLDLDIVVEKDGIGFARKLSGLLDAHLIKHIDFGTATITGKDGLKIDVATSRSESYPEPAALPRVKEGCIGDDLLRRDFSINAMACHIDFEKFGELVDLFDGCKDLKEGRIRFLHERSFIDDPTRIIRAVRFEQRLGFRIEARTLSFIKHAKKLKMLQKVGKHRLRDELILIFKERCSFRVLKRLNKIYNLSFINKGIRLDNDLRRIFVSLDKICIWFSSAFPQKIILDIWLMRLMAFLSAINVKKMPGFSHDYAFRKGETKKIISFKKEFRKIDKNLSKESLSAVKLHSTLDSLSYEVILLSYAVLKKQRARQRIKEFFLEHHHKKLTITGKDLLSLGVVPGPKFKDILQRVLCAKIDGIIHGRKEELEFARKIISRK